MEEFQSIAGIRVTPWHRGRVLATVRRALRERRPLRITFVNPDYARRALLDPVLLQDVNSFDLVLVDGNGVRLIAPLFGIRVPERLDTDSLAPDLFRLAAAHGHRVFLLGCAPGVAERARTRLARAFPGLSIVGTEHGYHDVERGHPGCYAAADSETIVDKINESQADVVLVSLPTGLQQRWVAEHGPRLRAPVIITAGSYLDHAAAGKGLDGSWYPRWADTLRLNWLYRLLREPRRLWRRYTIESLHFLVLVFRARFSSAR